MDAFISGAWRTAKRGEVLIGGAWRRITRAEVYRSGAWRPCLSFSPPLSVSASPNPTTGSTVSARPMTVLVTSQNAQATPVGGAAPYSYAWQVLSGGATTTSANMAACAFRAGVYTGQSVQGVAQVTCTDALGAASVAQVAYELYNESNQ